MQTLAAYARQHGLDFATLEDQRQALAQRAWKRGESSTIAQWLDENQAPLDRIVAASERTRYFSPLFADAASSAPALINVKLPGVQLDREAARMLGNRAMLRAGEGDMQGAWRDVLACQRLGRLVGHGATLIELLVGLAIEGVAHSTALAIVEAAPPSVDEAREQLAHLDALPPRATMADKLNLGERCMYLDSALLVAYQRTTLEELAGTEAAAAPWLSVQALASLDWDVPLRSGNVWFDKMEVANRLPAYSERRAALQSLEQELQAVLERAKALPRDTRRWDRAAAAEGMSDVFIALFFPALRAAHAAEARAAQKADLLRVALALALYRAEHGEHPALLQELTPDPLDRVPLDAFTDGLLHYRVEGDGYLLYSVGDNQRDDGGRGADDEPAGDDLVVRMPFDTPPSSPTPEQGAP